MNGRPGDHPLTDVLVHGLPAFSPDVDELIRRIDREGGWGSEIAAVYILGEQVRLRKLRDAGDDDGARVLLNNLRFLLESELRRVTRGG